MLSSLFFLRNNEASLSLFLCRNRAQYVSYVLSNVGLNLNLKHACLVPILRVATVESEHFFLQQFIQLFLLFHSVQYLMRCRHELCDLQVHSFDAVRPPALAERARAAFSRRAADPPRTTRDFFSATGIAPLADLLLSFWTAWRTYMPIGWSCVTSLQRVRSFSLSANWYAVMS
jgi:hypothetical protein